MKTISRLLILCLLLTGCAREETIEPVFTPAETVAVQGLYDTGSNLEISSSGAVKVFPISPRSGKAILPFGDGILLFSAGERTTITLFTGAALIPTARKSLDFSLEAQACGLHDDTLSYYDPMAQEMVILDSSLEVKKTIPAPKNLLGTPFLSQDGSLLYYGTPAALRVWDLQADTHRILRQTTKSRLMPQRLHNGGAILQCEAEEDFLFLSTDTGSLLSQETGPMKLATTEEGFLAVTWETNLWSMVFQDAQGTKALSPQVLSSEYFLLPDSKSVVTGSVSGEVVTLDRYDLVSGKRTASQMIRGSSPQWVTEANGVLWLLMYLPEYTGQAILRWDPSLTPVSDPHIYTSPHFTAQNPDQEGLNACQRYADSIGERYGLDIRIWQAGAVLAPEGITAQPEHRVNILMRELELLDHRLSQFPEGLLETTAANFDSLTIGLVAQISGSTQESSAQFFSGQDAVILLAVGDDSEAALYHQLFHVMQTHILSHSSAFDQWDTLNPQGFQYDYNYATNAIRNSGIYLTAENRYFLDTFSMSYPKEDQARVFEYAMLPGHEQLFKGKQMQRKLKAVCTGIRASYHLPEGGSYPWEMYLQ